METQTLILWEVVKRTMEEELLQAVVISRYSEQENLNPRVLRAFLCSKEEKAQVDK